MNRKQLVVLGLFAAVVAVAWMWGHRDYDVSTTASMVDDQGSVVAGAPESNVAVTVECAGPLAPPDPRLHIVDQAVGFAASGEPSRLVVDDNPCIARRSDARRGVFLLLVAAALATVAALVLVRTQAPSPSTVPEDRPVP